MQSSEHVTSSDAMLRELEGQIGMLGVPGLQRLQGTIAQRLAAEQQH
jgi:hypothetical protein